MSKQIITIGYEVPGKHENHVDFGASESLMDADVLLISPDSVRPWGDWVNFTSTDGGCYNVDASNRYLKNIAQLKKELEDHLKAGKNVFIFLTQEEISSLASGVSSKRKGESTYNTYSYSNYSFLPVDIGKITSASGKHVQFAGNSIFGGFYNKFKENLEYELYVENPKEAQIVFTGKDKSKILGAIYKAGSGHLVTLPTLTFNEKDFTEIKEEGGEKREYWNKKGLAFGNSFIKYLLEIDKSLAAGSEKTPTPDWVSNEKYSGKKEKKIYDSIKSNNEKIEIIQQKNEKLRIELEDER